MLNRRQIYRIFWDFHANKVLKKQSSCIFCTIRQRRRKNTAPPGAVPFRRKKRKPQAPGHLPADCGFLLSSPVFGQDYFLMRL